MRRDFVLFDRRFWSSCVLSIAFFAVVESEHESVLCNWLSAQINSWDNKCSESYDSCSFPHVTCTTVSSTTYYEINLKNKGLTGTLPAELSAITTLKELDLKDNEFTGTLPDSWSAFSFLEDMDLRQNSLTGILPNSWSSMSSIKHLRLAQNALTSTLPASWSALTNLETLNLNYNSLTGLLPSEWSSFTAVTKLYLAHNDLTGLLPASWSALDSINRLELHSNQFTSTIPESWSDLSDTATEINVSDNPALYGSLPATWSSELCLHDGTSIGQTPSLPEPAIPPEGDEETVPIPSSQEGQPLPEDFEIPSPTFAELDEEPRALEPVFSPKDDSSPLPEPVSSEPLIDSVPSGWYTPVPEPMLESLIETEPPEVEEPSVAPMSEDLDEALRHQCSLVATKCQATENGIYEEVPIDSAFSEGESYPGIPGFGIKLVDTSKPTRRGEPFEITRLYRSSSCGTLLQDVRLVSVVCPDDKYYCDTTGVPFCSLTEFCVDGEVLEESLDSQELREHLFSPPEIQLIGPEVIQISQGDEYLPCNACVGGLEDDGGVVQCDPGAEAMDSIEGTLTERIEACSTNSTIHYFSEVGLSPCNITTHTPGVQNITFTIRDSLGMTASVIRQIVVLPVCPEGEFICPEVLECSSRGSCFIHTREITDFGEIELDSLETEDANNWNNTLVLISTESIGELVNVTVGESYDKCREGEQSTETAKCEPGVQVIISPNQPSEYTIFVCPSTPCKHAGVEFCEAHLFDTTGLRSCNIDTNAPAGTQYEVAFMALPSNDTLPPLFVSRYLVLRSLCSEGEYPCEGSCSPVSCDQLLTLTSDAPPVLTLHYPDGLTLAYGIKTGCSILPCQTADSQSCGASAQDPEDGDLSSVIEVMETTPCEGTGCQYCNPYYFNSGDCLPGYYSYQFSVTDSGGNEVSSSTMEVNIVELAEIELSAENSTMGGSLGVNYTLEEIEAIDDLRSSLIESLDSGLSSTGKRMFLKEEDIGLTLTDGVLELQTCIITFADIIATIDAPTARNLTQENSKTPVPVFFASSTVFPFHFTRTLLQVSTSEEESTSTLEDVVALSVASLESTDLTDLNLALSGTRSALITEAINHALGAVLSVLGELDALYRASVSQVSELVESVRLSVPDTSKTEKEWMNKIEALFSDQRTYLLNIQEAMRESFVQDLLLESVDELVNATQSAASEMMAMMHAQYRDLNHMRNYQEFLNQVTNLHSDDRCIDASTERRYSFSVSLSDNRTESGSSKRRLMQVRGGVAGRTSGRGVTTDRSFIHESVTANVWGSYLLTNPMIYAFGPHAQPMEMETALRGATNHRNYIVGGTVIQTERRNENHICYGRFAPLDNYCYAISLQEEDMSKIPYGRDPVFLVDSSLYDEKSALRAGMYYDVDSQDISPSGVPYGFFTSEIPDKLGTHFVYLDIQFGRTTAVKMLQYLRDGRFMDSITDTVTVRFVTYNPQFPLTILAVNEIKCRWETDVKCEYKIDALPDVEWTGTTPAAKRIVVLICGSLSLTVLYWMVLLQNIIKTITAQKSIASVRTVTGSHLPDILVALALAISTIVTIVLVSYEVTDLGEKLRFDVYDSSHFTGAHWLLHKRLAESSAVSSSRWSLPSDITDIVRLSGFLESMDTYRHLASINSVFQTLALMGLIIRLLSLASVVPKVSIITSTLSGCIEPLVYFMIPFLLLLTSFAFMGSSCFGYRVKTLSSLSTAFTTLMEFTFFGGGDLIKELTPEGTLLHPLEWILAEVFKASLACFSIFIFINFVLAILTDRFLIEKARNKSKKGWKLSDLNPFKPDPLSRLLTLRERSLQEKRVQLKQILPCCSTLSVKTVEDNLTIEDQSESFIAPRGTFQTDDMELQLTTSNALYMDSKSEASEGDTKVDEGCSVPVKRLATMQHTPKRLTKDLGTAIKDLQKTIVSFIRVYRQCKDWTKRATQELEECVKCHTYMRCA